MLKHNFLLIIRNFRRFKSSFFINLLGLSTGLACTLLIYLWVNDELNFDQFHQKGDRIYQVMENKESEGSIRTTGQTLDFLGKVLAQEMPEVELAAVATPPNFFPSFTLSANEHQVKGIGKFVESDFLNIFSYPLILGNGNPVLTNNDDIVISESLAKSLFKTADNCIGKSVEWQIMDLTKLVTIKGVLKDLPDNSSEKFDFLLTFDAFREIMGIKGTDMNWNNSAPFLTYVLVKEKTDLVKLNSKVAGFMKLKSKTDQHRALFLKQYADNYLHGNYKNGIETGGRIEYVNLFSIIAIFILLIASINFMNLSTANASRRILEAGIKKVFGAQRNTLVWQYLGESLLMTIISFLVSLVLVVLFLPGFGEIAGKHLELVFNARLVIACSVIVILTALLAGSYPALYLSGFSPIMLLKKQLGTTFGELWSRKGLVVFQFAVSVLFIVSVLVVYKQIEFVQNKSLGYNKDNVLYFETDGKIAGNVESFLAEVKNISGVESSSSMLGNIIAVQEGGGMPGKVMWKGKEVLLENSAVNYNLIELLGIEIKEGRTFSRQFPTDVNKVIYNEAAIEQFGITDPVGKIIDGQEILGVVKNFHNRSVRELIKPYSFRLEPKAATNILIRIRKGFEKRTVDAIQKLYHSYNPGFVFNYKFLDQDFQAQYVAEKRVSLLSRYFAGLAIIISCLGLFGLASFTIERRSKEIAIRKVSGSGELEIVLLLTGEFAKMVLLSIFIALPISYFLVAYWLESFVYRIDLHWMYFVGAGLIALFTALATVGIQTVRAAKINPARILASE